MIQYLSDIYHIVALVPIVAYPLGISFHIDAFNAYAKQDYDMTSKRINISIVFFVIGFLGQILTYFRYVK